MIRARLALSLHDNRHIELLVNALDSLRDRGFVVVADLLRDRMSAPLATEGCITVGEAGPKNRVAKQVTDAIGISYPIYVTCVMQSREALLTAVSEAQLTSALRVRVFRSRPPEEVLIAWGSDELAGSRDDARGTDEAGLVLTVVDDGTALDMTLDKPLSEVLEYLKQGGMEEL